MFKKQISKFSFRSLSKLEPIKKFLLGFFAILLVAPLFFTLNISPASAAASFQFSETGKLTNETQTGNCPVNQMPFKSTIEVNKPKSGSNFVTGINQDLKFYVSFEPTNEVSFWSRIGSSLGDYATIMANCQKQASEGQIQIRAKVIYKRFTVAGNNPYIDLVQADKDVFQMSFSGGKLEANFGVTIPKPNVGQPLIGDASPSTTGDRIHVSFEVNANLKEVSFKRNISGAGITGLLQKQNVVDEAVTQASQPTKQVATTGEVDIQEVAKNLELHSTQEKKGFETVYRYAEDQKDTDPARKGKIIIPFYVSWKGTGPAPALNSPLIRKQDELFKASLYGFYFGVSKEYKSDKATPKCGTSLTDFWCSDLIIAQAPDQPKELAVGGNLNLSFSDITAIEDSTPTTTTTTKPKAVKKLVGLPMVSAKYSNDNAVMTNNTSAFTVEVYSTFEDLQKACKEAQPDADCTKPENLYYGQKYAQVTTTGAQDENGTVAKTLIDFIRRVVVNITLLLTGLIYQIFAFILVPILKALISIHPYEDKFVDFIYPGWIIIRNLTNIAFIVALLIMGLKILFQQEGVGASRSFLLRLILMALLVNFSLVIAQSIVAVADTVQSQFLPEDTRVLEVLGQKLMVDPVLIFRDSIDNNATNNFEETPASADIFKPIVLLILSIAAFWSFVALAGFIFVRIVVLWVLYMLSPLAYFGRLLSETQSYANQWWQEFIKQAMTVPILAFFLNISALMAVTFAVRSGNSVESNAATDYLIGPLTGNLADFALTVISHFIVLLFLVAGMYYASKAGGIGSKAVVKYAKKGFDNVTIRPTKWAANKGYSFAKNQVKDFADTTYQRRIQGGLLDVKAWKDNWKASKKATTEKVRAQRIARKGNKLNPGNLLPKDATSWGELGQNWKQAGKYLWAKAKFEGPQRLADQSNRLKDMASILTDPQRADLNIRTAGYKKEKEDLEVEQTNLTKDQTISLARAAEYKKKLQEMADSAEKKALDIEKDREEKLLKGKISTGGAEEARLIAEQDALEKEAKEYQEGVKAFDDAYVKSNSAVTGQVSIKEGDIDLDAVSPVFNVEQFSADLSDEVKKATKTFEESEKTQKNDDDKRRKYGITSITEDEKKDLSKQSEEIDKRIPAVTMVTSKESIAALNSLKKSEGEKIEKIDDVDGLKEMYKEALAKNNSALAAAIAEKMAKIGGLDDLLHERGFENNLKDFQKFIEKEFKDLAPQLRLQLGSQISAVAKQNGNLALSNATQYEYNKSTGEVVVNWASEQKADQKRFAKQKNTTANSAAKFQKTDISKEKDGKWVLDRGFIEAMNNWSPTSVANFVKESSPALIKHVLTSTGNENIKASVKNLLNKKA